MESNLRPAIDQNLPGLRKSLLVDVALPNVPSCIAGAPRRLAGERKTSENPLNSMKTKFTVLLTTLLAAAGCFVFSSAAQQLIYQEGFNTDGEAATPQRYTTTGRAVYTVDQLIALDPNTQQRGPAYWAHNFDVPNSFVGVPAPTPARRAILAWDAAITADAVSPQMRSVLTGTFNWLLS